YFRQRARTLPRLVELIESVCTARPGNYLVALPSFEYLEQLAAALSKAGPGLSVCKQHPGMTDPEREAFLAAFSDQGETRIGLIVLGGVFGESVDFSHAPLSGVICIGVGVPPGSRQRTEMARYFDQRIGPGGGTTVAYLQPAMTKILQMAGRLLRGPEDRGILCLVDDRFARPDYQRFFPEHWRPVLVGSQQVAGRVHEFWRTSAELPRLPGSAGASDSHAVETLV
ncbi:MAG TPA: helicase C-terminal domain-containing protein, partial [Pseudomonadales bacterium]